MAKFHPLYDGVWADDRLGSFEGKSFFIFLFGNARVRPSGIYRATDELLAAETGLSVKRVREHLRRLQAAGRIVRDGSWVFVVGYLKRQPHGERLLSGVHADLDTCTSPTVLKAFGERYPALHRRSSDRLETIKQRSPDLSGKFPPNTMQLQSNTNPPLPPPSRDPPVDNSRPTRGPVRSVLDQESTGGEGSARGRLTAHSNGHGPVAVKSVVASLLAGLAPRDESPPALVPRGPAAI
jgi:hypothetical protein